MRLLGFYLSSLGFYLSSLLGFYLSSVCLSVAKARNQSGV